MRLLFALHLPHIHMFLVVSARVFLSVMSYLPIWSIVETFLANSAFAELNFC